jgi:hypothetical protein
MFVIERAGAVSIRLNRTILDAGSTFGRSAF